VNPDRFARTFDVLDLLVLHPDGLRLSEVSQSLGAPVSSTHNLLQTMVAAEVASVTEDLRYTIGPRSVRLGVRIINSLGVRSAARRHLEKLAQTIGNDVYLAVKVGHRVVYVDRFVGTQPVTVNIRLGDALALHATAVGKLFSAYVPELRERVFSRRRQAWTVHTLTDSAALTEEFQKIRTQGFSISREEAIEGIFGIAVPVLDESHGLLAAIHVSALSAGLVDKRVTQVIQDVTAVARLIEIDMGVPTPNGVPERRPRTRTR
jgi:DNA-binding IclR family transcriptional regulator